jgi:phosphate transport system substrate-binding protein
MRNSRAPMPSSIRWIAAVGLMLCAAPQVGIAADDVVRIGGTGMALAAMAQIGEGLTSADPSIRVEVLPSLGTPGGLRALAERAIDVAVIGRSLTAAEQAKGAVEAACMTTALVFASSHPAPSGFAQADLPGIYAGSAPLWPDGKPLKILLRSRAGSENAYLIAAIPGMEAALEKAYRRPDVPVATTDQENADLASRTANSFAIMSLLQIRAERLNLRTIPLDGVPATAETLANQTYPLSMRVCVVIASSPTPSAARFVAHLRSAPAQALLQTLGAAPSK